MSSAAACGPVISFPFRPRSVDRIPSLIFFPFPSPSFPPLRISIRCLRDSICPSSATNGWPAGVLARALKMLIKIPLSSRNSYFVSAELFSACAADETELADAMNLFLIISKFTFVILYAPDFCLNILPTKILLTTSSRSILSIILYEAQR